VNWRSIVARKREITNLAIQSTREDGGGVLPDNFDHISFQFITGGDNLRSNSELTADVFKNDGTAIAADAELHPQDSGTWDNGSTSPRITIPVVATTNVSDLNHINVILRSHNDAFQSDDAWNVAQVLVQLSSGDSPLILTWTEQGSQASQFILSGHDGKSNVMVITTDTLEHP